MEPTAFFDYVQKLAELLKSPYGWLALTPFVIIYVLNLNKYFGLPLRQKTLKEKLEDFNMLLQDDDLSPELKRAIRDKKEEFVFKSLFKIKAKTKLRSAMIDFIEKSPPEVDFDNLHIARQSVTLDANQEKLAVKISKSAYAYAISSFIVGYLSFFAGLAFMLLLLPSDNVKLPLSVAAFRIFSSIGVFVASGLMSLFFLNPMREIVQARFIAKNLDTLPQPAKEQKTQENAELPASGSNSIE